MIFSFSHDVLTYGCPVFTAEQMREFDRVAAEEFGVPSIVLMENAALRVVEFLEMKFGPLHDKRGIVFCGKGNNGGDGFAIARHLRALGCRCDVRLVGDADSLKGDVRTNFEILKKCYEENVRQRSIPAEKLPTFEKRLKEYRSLMFYDKQNDYDFILDAVLGTGVRKNSEWDRDLDAAILELQERIKIPLVAVDIPSGLNADNGEAITRMARANYTVTLVGPKRGMFVRKGLEACGEIWIGDIGTPRGKHDGVAYQDTGCFCITRKFARALLPERSLDAHKGSAGRAIVIGGSFGMSGAPTLAARAVLRSGAGLCIACLPDKVLSTFAIGCPEATSKPLPCDEEGRLIVEAADELPNIWEGAQVVAIGPGISRSQSTLELVRRVVRECPLPLVVDADALYALREIESDVKARTAPTILTPHPGEMGELMQVETSAVNGDRFGISLACAEKYGGIVLLKGARSIVAIPNFKTCREQITGAAFVNLTGNPGMATGGSGDVLTGTIAGLLAQTQDAQTATLLGVYAHGLAGDLCFETKGNGLIAGDLADALPQALLEIAKPLEVAPNARLRKLQ